MAVPPTINRQGLQGRLEGQLRELRVRGLENPRLDDLPDVVGVAQVLVPDLPELRAQVEAALELAISDYTEDEKTSEPVKAQEVAKLWFGIDPSVRALDQEARHEKAWERLGRGKLSTFKSYRAPEIRKFLAGRLVKRYDQAPADSAKSTAPYEPQPAHTSDQPQSEPPRHSPASEAPPRWRPNRQGSILRRRIKVTPVPVLIGALGLAALLVVLLVIAISALSEGSRAVQGTAVPPRGTVLNAQTGKPDKHPVKAPPRQLDEIGNGDIFRVCDRTTEHPCAWKPKKYILRAKVGDVLDFALMLHNGGEAAVPYATFYVRHEPMTSSQFGSEVLVEMVVSAPGGAEIISPPNIHPIRVIPIGHPESYASVVYIPGSTTLWDRKRHLLGHLPDGIMEEGVSLTKIGEPATCFFCDLKYVRFIHFKVTLSST